MSRQAPVRPDHVVEPARNTQTENRTSSDDQHDSHTNRHLTISRNESLNTFVYRSIDEESGDVLWQYPPNTCFACRSTGVTWKLLRAVTRSTKKPKG